MISTTVVLYAMAPEDMGCASLHTTDAHVSIIQRIKWGSTESLVRISPEAPGQYANRWVEPPPPCDFQGDDSTHPIMVKVPGSCWTFQSKSKLPLLVGRVDLQQHLLIPFGYIFVGSLGLHHSRHYSTYKYWFMFSGVLDIHLHVHLCIVGSPWGWW